MHLQGLFTMKTKYPLGIWEIGMSYILEIISAMMSALQPMLSLSMVSVSTMEW